VYFKHAGLFKQEDGTCDSTVLDNLQQNKTEQWDEVVTHPHPPCTFPDHSDADMALSICEQLMEEDIIRSIRTPDCSSNEGQ
jgi:hypothetical protein